MEQLETLVGRMPYWAALGSLHSTAAGDSLYVMAGLLCPGTILNGAGDSVGTIGSLFVRHFTPDMADKQVRSAPLDLQRSAGFEGFQDGHADEG